VRVHTQETSTPKLGLRERKKQQTRETIERAALRLFAERGYEQTTLADIAEAADVSPRTIFSYFEGKEDILFCHESANVDAVRELLANRPAGATTVDALREFVASLPGPGDDAILRKNIIAASPELNMRKRAHIAGFDEVLTESIAKDLGAGPGDLRPALVAASMTAAFTAMSDRLEEPGDQPQHEDAMRILDEVLEFLQGGLRALQAR
jgi:AcrR family transcriptional regulator